MALGTFLAFVEYRGWDGGVVGLKLHDLLHLLIGRTAALLPPLLIALGALIFVDSPLRHLRPLRLGVLVLLASVTLAVSTTDTLAPQHHGGLVGAYARIMLSGLVGDVGVSILVVTGVLAGIVLITGASIGAIMRSSGRHVARAAGTGARMGGEVARRYRERPSSRPTLVAVPGEKSEKRGRGARPLDGSKEYADIFGDIPDFQPPAAETEQAPAEPDPVEVVEPGAEPDDAVTAEVVSGAVELDASPRPKTEYRLPSPAILKKSAAGKGGGDDHREVARKLVDALANFGVEARCVGMVSGPRVTRYELQLAPGIKVSRVSQLRDDLAYALATTEIRILAPIPGKQAVGVEVPNTSHNTVTLGDIYTEAPSGSSPLTAWLGKDISGAGVACDLAKMPHLLIAGTTGSGKSGSINAILCSILLRATPDEVRMILVDPKRVELNHYESIPHLLTPVVTNMKNAALVLQNIVREMESRYELMGAVKARNLAEWNRQRLELGRDRVPHILVVIDELADLMMVSPADVEDAIIRLAQKSRAVGIHLVLATQSPRVDVITGMIKANVPSRIAFAVSSQTDSRVILDVNGAEALLGAGDMLYKPLGTSKLQRVQGAYISEEETRRIVEACRKQGEPTFEEELLELPSDVEPEQLDADEDPVLNDAIRLVAQHQTASVSLLQRRLRVGYTRAGRLIDMLERRGIVSGYEGSKARNVLITEADLPRIVGDTGPAAAVDEPGDDLTF
ncbi:MAG TPA: DNA translocase FtsK 4TM domain-containing protein [Gaiellales bacterium]|nr:DNA translocase FtsK 4TM domain-containing protein [Gaiellales bacterium]